MVKRVWAAAPCRDSQAAHTVRNNPVQSSVSDRPIRCIQPEKEFGAWSRSSYLTNVATNGICQRWNKWGDPRLTALLSLGDRQRPALPINVFKAKPEHFTDPETIHSKQQDNSSIADVALTMSLGTRKQPLDIRPRRPLGKLLVLV
ncbi:MAG TPA: hypothetical protein VE422_51205 [Terriglobia bacterium]|nr:hypothetical protein [Terriglobia bacterium]